MKERFWSLIRKGDEQAFRMLYDDYEDKLYRYGMRIAADEELVNNAIVALFARIFERRYDLSEPISVFAYLASSLRRMIFDELRRRRKGMVPFSDAMLDRESFMLEIDAEATMVKAECDEQVVRALQRAIDSLTPQQREIIYLKFFEGMDNSAIAEVTGCSNKTVRNTASSALTRLREDETLNRIYGAGIVFLLLCIV